LKTIVAPDQTVICHVLSMKDFRQPDHATTQVLGNLPRLQRIGIVSRSEDANTDLIRSSFPNRLTQPAFIVAWGQGTLNPVELTAVIARGNESVGRFPLHECLKVALFSGTADLSDYDIIECLIRIALEETAAVTATTRLSDYAGRLVLNEEELAGVLALAFMAFDILDQRLKELDRLGRMLTRGEDERHQCLMQAREALQGPMGYRVKQRVRTAPFSDTLEETSSALGTS
jgi:hypothetical protein